MLNEINTNTNANANTKLVPQYTVRLGETILIPCIILNRKQATVIWQYSKSRIPETLTVGYFYYRKDYRIRVIANATQESEQAWNLEIRKVKLEDEGYYLCKVMAEPQSLKQVVYVRVNVDLKVLPQDPLNVKLDETVVITCNTSYDLHSSTLASSSSSSSTSNQNKFLNKSKQQYLAKTLPNQNQGQQQQQQHQQPRLLWYKDGEHFSINDHHFGQQQQQQHEGFVHEQQKLANTSKNANAILINYRIDYYAKPVLWSRIVFKSFKVQNIGKYTCKFRHQNVSTILSPYLGMKLMNLFVWKFEFFLYFCQMANALQIRFLKGGTTVKIV